MENLKEKILKLREQDYTYSEIVKELGCSLSTVSYHCGTPDKSKTWKVYDYPEDKLREAVLTSVAFSHVLEKLGIPVSGGRYASLKTHLNKYGIDYSHFEGQAWAGRQSKENNTFSKEEFMEKVLIDNGSNFSSHNLKLKLYHFGIKIPKCECCGLTTWQNKPISLHLDHINGNNKDNRLINLRILCPNCHSQTDTYAGKKLKGIKKNKKQE